MPKSTRLILICASFGLGALVGDLLPAPKAVLPFFLGLSGLIALTWLLSKFSVRQVFLLLLTGLLFGWYWASFFQSRLPVVEAGLLNPQPATVSSFPDDKGRNQQFLIKLENGDKFLVKAPRFPAYEYGDKFIISGEIVPLDQLFKDDRFDYGKYLLARYGAQGVLEKPEIRVVGTGGNPIIRQLSNNRETIAERLRLIYSPSTSSLAQGLVLGRTGDFPTSLNQAFQRTGTSHLVALSGFNISIIIVIVYQLLKGVSRHLAIFATLISILLFVLLVGPSPSIVRAALMGSTYLLAFFAGRRPNPTPAVFAAGFLMIALNPMIVAYDGGFQLSFLAVLGLIFLSPRIEQKWRLIYFKERLSKPIYDAGLATLAAQLGTLPLLVWQYGRLSVISPVVNILVVPIVTWTTIAVIINAVIALFSVWLGKLIALVVVWPLQYILQTIKLFSRLPQASVAVSGAGLLIFAVAYIIIILWLFYPLLRHPERATTGSESRDLKS